VDLVNANIGVISWFSLLNFIFQNSGKVNKIYNKESVCFFFIAHIVHKLVRRKQKKLRWLKKIY